MPSSKEYMREYRAKKAEEIRAQRKAYLATDHAKALKREQDRKRYQKDKQNPDAMQARQESRSKSYWSNLDRSRKVARQKAKRYREKKADELNEKQRAQYRAMPIEKRQELVRKRAEYQKQYRQLRADDLKSYRQQYYQKQIESDPDLHRKRYLANREMYIQNAYKRTERIKDRGRFTKEDICRLLESQAGKCNGCKCSIENGFEIDHVMPIALGGMNTADNLQLLCRTCNRRKSAKHPDIWAAELGRLFA